MNPSLNAIFDKEQLKLLIKSIKDWILREIECLALYSNESDFNTKGSLLEDAYLLHFKSIREGKMLSDKDYNANNMKEVFNKDKKDLHIMEFEEYERKVAE